MAESPEDKVAEITLTDDGLVRMTLRDPSGELQTLRVTIPPPSAYKLGEALCQQALKALRTGLVEELEAELKKGEPGE